MNRRSFVAAIAGFLGAFSVKRCKKAESVKPKPLVVYWEEDSRCLTGQWEETYIWVGKPDRFEIRYRAQ